MGNILARLLRAQHIIHPARGNRRGRPRQRLVLRAIIEAMIASLQTEGQADIILHHLNNLIHNRLEELRAARAAYQEVQHARAALQAAALAQNDQASNSEELEEPSDEEAQDDDIAPGPDPGV